MEPGALPAVTAWGFDEAASVAVAPVISDGSGPSGQHVAYATTDGRVHLRALDTGAEVVPGGTSVVDSALAAEGTALTGSGLVARGATLFVPHDDGAGVEVARVDAGTGQRAGPDVAVPDSLGCSVAGAPLLTPMAGDGTALLVFTVEGNCGPALIRAAVDRDGGLGAIARTPVAGLVTGIPPVQVVLGVPPRFAFLVARRMGLDVIATDGSVAGAIELGDTPAAVAAPETLLAPTPTVLVAGGSRVHRLDQGMDGVLRPAASADVRGTALALGGGAGPRIAVAGSSGLTVLRSDLEIAGTAPGVFTAVSAAGDLGFAVRDGRLVAVDLATLAATDLGAATVAPAIARGYVATGPGAVLTTDVTPPSVTLGDGFSAEATDDRGVAAVDFGLGGRSLGTATAAPYAITPDLRHWPPRRYRLEVRARDNAGNVARATRRLRLSCRTRRGTRRADRLRGRAGRDCVRAGRGRDRINVRRGGADAVRCGPGRDRVRADPFDRVGDDCERVRTQ